MASVIAILFLADPHSIWTRIKDAITPLCAICQGEGFFRWEGAPAHLQFEDKRLISRMQLLCARPTILFMLRYRMLVLIFALAFNVSGQGGSDKRLEFLLGKWVGIAGEKDTPLGAGQGAFSFEAQLNQKIIVRHNHAAYNSGAQHDDLMVIYFDGPNASPRAMYFDTEGHVIRYNLTFPSANAVVFESDGTQPARLKLRRLAANTKHICVGPQRRVSEAAV
jgi:hypothetical protein